jgi:hypothetical protein
VSAIPERFKAVCEFGGEEIDTRTAGVFQFTTGWVMQRDGGGGHGISLPKRELRFCCRYHMEREIAGYTKQAVLL